MTKSDILTAAAAINQDLRDALAFTLRWEGVGWESVDGDPGGETNSGITTDDYAAWLREHGKPPASVRHITAAEIAAVYRDHYWTPLYAADLPAPVGLVLFDTGVNVGNGRAAPWLRKVLGVSPVGAMTSGVVVAARNYVDKHGAMQLAAGVLTRRQAYYNTLAADHPGLRKFLRGWTNRVNDLKATVGITD